MALQQPLNPFRIVRNGFRLFCRWFVNVFSFRPAVVLEYDTDQRLLYQHTSCRLSWRVRNAYRVSIFINEKLYRHYAPLQTALVPVGDVFNVRLIAHSIYGSVARTLTIPVVCLEYQEAKRPALYQAQTGQPIMTQALVVSSPVIVPNTPTPMFNPAVARIDFGVLRATGAELEAEIIKQAYQTETNTHYYAD